MFLDIEKEELQPWRKTVNGSQGYINSTDIENLKTKINNKTHDKVPLDCMWIIQVQSGWKVFIQIKIKYKNMAFKLFNFF